jgi:hypothetical protein
MLLGIVTATATPPQHQATSTVTGGEDVVGAPLLVTTKQMKRARAWRRAVLTCLVVFLGLGLLDVFGVHTETATSEGGGYEIEATYARTGRPGLGVPVDVQVTKDGGFGDRPVRISMTTEYLDKLAQFSFDPDPASATQTDKDAIWEFDPPPGDTFTFSVSTQLAPDQHPGSHEATVSVLDDNDNPIVSTAFKTWEWP